MNPQQPNDSEINGIPLWLFKVGAVIRDVCGKEIGNKLIDALDPYEAHLFALIQDEILKARKDQTFKVIQCLVKAGAISDNAASTALAICNAQLNQPNTNKEIEDDITRRK